MYLTNALYLHIAHVVSQL